MRVFMKKAKFEITRNPKTQEFYYTLKANNGAVLAKSQGFTRKSACIRATERLARHAHNAELSDLVG
jgi:uncharacterized protein YegP (UPF0339 family)